MKVYRDLSALPELTNTVLTIGSFDGVHKAHQKIINKLNKLAQSINGESVVISFHPHPRQIIYPKDNGLELLTSLEEKLSLFEQYGVDIVVIIPFTIEFSQMHPKDYIENFLIKNFNPKYIVIGYDHRFGLNRQGDISLLREFESIHEFKISEIAAEQVNELTISSTKIRNALKTGEIDLANLLLGHPYKINGKVVHGEKMGTKMGYPTANIKTTEKFKLIPFKGIYAAKIIIDEVGFDGMLYIGKKPTFHEDEKMNIEINIFDFDQNIYDKNVTLEIVSFIREDQKFDSKEALIAQLNQDEIDSKKVLRKEEKKKITKTAVAILTYNNQEYLESFLPSVLDSSKDNFDIYIIDNASQDDSIEYLEEWHPEVNIIALEKNYGFAEGYNQGLKQIKNEYIAILNSDVLVTENWLDPLIKVLDLESEVACVQPKILSLEEKNKFEYAGACGGYIDKFGYPFCRGRIFDTIEVDKGQYDETAEIFWASGAAMVIRKSVFDSLGGFDKLFFAHQEEIDLCWRIQNQGLKTKCIPASKVYHLGGGTLDYKSPRKTYLNFRNNLSLIYKNNSSFVVFKILFARFFFDGVAFIKEILSGNFSVGGNIIKGWFGFISLIPKLKKSQFKRRPSRIYQNSIVLDYFLSKKKTFSKLENKV